MGSRKLGTGFVAIVAMLMLAVPAEAQSQWYGDVMLDVSRDAMTDRAQYTTMTMSGPEDPANGDAGLGFYCEGSNTQMVAISISGFSIADDRTLMLRFDRSEPERLHWSAEQRGTQIMVYSRDRRTVNRIVEQAKGSARAVVRDLETGTDYVFSLDGMTAALSKVPCL